MKNDLNLIRLVQLRKNDVKTLNYLVSGTKMKCDIINNKLSPFISKKTLRKMR